MLKLILIFALLVVAYAKPSQAPSFTITIDITEAFPSVTSCAGYNTKCMDCWLLRGCAVCDNGGSLTCIPSIIATSTNITFANTTCKANGGVIRPPRYCILKEIPDAIRTDIDQNPIVQLDLEDLRQLEQNISQIIHNYTSDIPSTWPADKLGLTFIQDAVTTYMGILETIYTAEMGDLQTLIAAIDAQAAAIEANSTFINWLDVKRMECMNANANNSDRRVIIACLIIFHVGAIRDLINKAAALTQTLIVGSIKAEKARLQLYADILNNVAQEATHRLNVANDLITLDESLIFRIGAVRLYLFVQLNEHLDAKFRLIVLGGKIRELIADRFDALYDGLNNLAKEIINLDNKIIKKAADYAADWKANADLREREYRELIRSFLSNALVCQVNATNVNTVTTSISFKLTCRINGSEVAQDLNALKAQIIAFVNGHLGTTDVTDPVTDPGVIPPAPVNVETDDSASAKRAISQYSTTDYSSTATITDPGTTPNPVSGDTSSGTLLASSFVLIAGLITLLI